MAAPVLIFGAGVGGLALAQGLLKQNIAFQLFEKDQSLRSRVQGYRFRISPEGVNALEHNLPHEQFKRVIRCCGYMKPVDCNVFKSHLHSDTAQLKEVPFVDKTSVLRGQPLAADRTVLRKILSEGLESHITFNVGYTNYVVDTDGVVVTLTDGREIRGSLLVGADGIWSTARHKLLPDYTLLDTSARLVFGKLFLNDQLRLQLSPDVLDCGGISLVHDAQGRFISLNEPMLFDHSDPAAPDDYVYWGVYLPIDRKPDAELFKLSAAEIAQMMQDLVRDWHPSLRCLFDTQAVSIHRVLSSPPVIATWDPQVPVTLIGDAIHAMSPTAAFGATTALQDAAVLTRELINYVHNKTTLKGALRAYETQMRQYAAAAIERSTVSGKFMFGMPKWDKMDKVYPPHL